MTGELKGNLVGVGPDDPAFIIGDNIVNYFEIGEAGRTQYFLKGEIIGKGEFLFNGTLFAEGVSGVGVIIDNFPKGPAPTGWVMQPVVDGEGFTLRNQKTNEIIFGYVVRDKHCFVTTNIYDENGDTVAQADRETLEIRKGALLAGKPGIRFRL